MSIIDIFLMWGGISFGICFILSPLLTEWIFDLEVSELTYGHIIFAILNLPLTLFVVLYGSSLFCFHGCMNFGIQKSGGSYEKISNSAKNIFS